MRMRGCFLALALLMLVLQSGCCGGLFQPWPCGRTYYGRQCGPRWWNEWFSHPPDCCDPCNDCGQYVGSRNPYVVGGPMPSKLYSDGVPSVGPPTPPTPPGRQPTPAAPQEPFQQEELPMGEPMTHMRRPQQGRAVSYHGPVDSPRNSRTLGKPRARLFSPSR